jgi:hypothetical protein
MLVNVGRSVINKARCVGLGTRKIRISATERNTMTQSNERASERQCDETEPSNPRQRLTDTRRVKNERGDVMGSRVMKE